MPKSFWGKIIDLWCRLMHPTPMWPVHGHYRCPACWREYSVPWEVRSAPASLDTVSQVMRPEHSRVTASRITRPAHSW